MLKILWGTLKNLAASRKVMLAVISGIIYVLGRAGIDATQADLLPIVGPLWLALFGTGAEDVAKHIAAGRVAAAASSAPATVTNVVNQPAGAS